ncbi:hypothetical protein F5884DRAFT_394428 [Xylogone sp. PMI_703]|nr:hypothetical protein F5884DRAFT_394428 [Xylogone sp. PMI_703]
MILVFQVCVTLLTTRCVTSSRSLLSVPNPSTSTITPLSCTSLVILAISKNPASHLLSIRLLPISFTPNSISHKSEMIHFRLPRTLNAHRNARILHARGHTRPIKLPSHQDPQKYTYFLDAGAETWLFRGSHLTRHLPLLPPILRRSSALRYDVLDHFYGQWVQNIDPYIYEGAMQSLFAEMYRIEEAEGHLSPRYWQQWHLYNAWNSEVTVFEDILARLPVLEGLGDTQELEDVLYDAVKHFMATYEILRADRGFGAGVELYERVILMAARFVPWVAVYIGEVQLFVLVYWVVKIAYVYGLEDGWEAARDMVRQLDREDRQELENEAGRRRETDGIANDIYLILVFHLY